MDARLVTLALTPRLFPSTELDSDKRCYPGGYLILGFASSVDAEALFKPRPPSSSTAA